MSPALSRGFTQIELIVILVLVGIVAAVALPRFGGETGIEGPAFAAEAKSRLRYARDSAIAGRRRVCAAFTAQTLRLAIASAAGSNSCDRALAGPGGENPYILDAADSRFKDLTGFVAGQFPASIDFDALGRPVDAAGRALAAPTRIAVAGGGTLLIEAETGHVH